jgi:hypothetical protein
MPEYSAQSFVQELISLANSLEGGLQLYVDPKQLRFRIDSLGGLDWHALGIDSSDVPDSPRRRIDRFSNR